MSEFASAVPYLEYLKQQGVNVEASLEQQVKVLVSALNLDEPQTAADYQGTAVLALIEAEQSEELQSRQLYVDLALQALEAAIATGEPSLALSQWTIIQNQLGNLNETAQTAFNELLTVSTVAFESNQTPCQLVYLPVKGPGSSGAIAAELLPSLLQSHGLQSQRLLLAAEALCRSHLVLYSPMGGRSLQILSQLQPHAASLNLKIGVYQLAGQQPEGFLNLHQARTQYTANASATLELAVRALTSTQLAADLYKTTPIIPSWKQQTQVMQAELAKVHPAWKNMAEQSFCVYLPYDDGICFAAEPTLSSIVTRVLLAEGDWFEKEMELWRQLIQPGMTVIDVGANSGVYTFSAAKRVGATGQVIAIEPFQGCVDCLKQTCAVNAFSWVKVYAAAASDKPGTSFLKLSSASELNELRAEADPTEQQDVQKVDCLTLDSLIQLENLERVDFLKIDAEGHEEQVLSGASQLIRQFKPLILYENIAGSSGSNLAMAAAVQAMDYHLFAYQSWTRQFVPIQSAESMNGILNVIAISAERLSEYSYSCGLEMLPVD